MCLRLRVSVASLGSHLIFSSQPHGPLLPLLIFLLIFLAFFHITPVLVTNVPILTIFLTVGI